MAWFIVRCRPRRAAQGDPVPGRSIRALELVLPPTFLARGQAWFIVRCHPRRAAQGGTCRCFFVEASILVYSILCTDNKLLKTENLRLKNEKYNASRTAFLRKGLNYEGKYLN